MIVSSEGVEVPFRALLTVVRPSSARDVSALTLILRSARSCRSRRASSPSGGSIFSASTAPPSLARSPWVTPKLAPTQSVPTRSFSFTVNAVVRGFGHLPYTKPGCWKEARREYQPRRTAPDHPHDARHCGRRPVDGCCHRAPVSTGRLHCPSCSPLRWGCLRKLPPGSRLIVRSDHQCGQVEEWTRLSLRLIQPGSWPFSQYSEASWHRQSVAHERR